MAHVFFVYFSCFWVSLGLSLSYIKPFIWAVFYIICFLTTILILFLMLSVNTRLVLSLNVR